VTGTDVAVATSGTAERDAHIRNPHDLTTPSALACVTIVGKDPAYADAYATAAFAMGPEAPDWIATLDGYQGLVIRADGGQWAPRHFATTS
jgi:thiamine biosynthesis lipoprotein